MNRLADWLESRLWLAFLVVTFLCAAGVAGIAYVAMIAIEHYTR